MNQDPNYTSLRAVLDEAYAQAATGKQEDALAMDEIKLMLMGAA